MYSFQNDYSEGAHPRILQALIETNLVQTEGYGTDEYTKQATAIIKQKIRMENAEIHFFTGGTQTNLTAISAFLRPHEAVIAADSGHVSTHEAGAIEATGHKVITASVNAGKLKVEDILKILKIHTDEHMVKPKLVYISNSTEVGTIYKKAELQSLSELCKEKGLILFLDGARLGAALTSNENDLSLADIAKLTDAFYIGGTKNGALLGEALVICNNALKADFRYIIKQNGGLFAKGRIIGIQFLELFKDELYFDLARHANKMAEILAEGIDNCGYKTLAPAATNQVFPILPVSIISRLSEKYLFHHWTEISDDEACIRLVTSWATDEVKVRGFIEDLNEYKGEV